MILNPQAETNAACTAYQLYAQTKASFEETLYAVPVDGDSYTYIDEAGTKWVADTVELFGGRVDYVRRVENVQIMQTPVRTDITNTEAGQTFLKLSTTEGMTRITADAEVSVKLKVWEE